jgi:hypothetical protein
MHIFTIALSLSVGLGACESYVLDDTSVLIQGKAVHQLATQPVTLKTPPQNIFASLEAMTGRNGQLPFGGVVTGAIEQAIVGNAEGLANATGGILRSVNFINQPAGWPGLSSVAQSGWPGYLNLLDSFLNHTVALWLDVGWDNLPFILNVAGKAPGSAFPSGLDVYMRPPLEQLESFSLYLIISREMAQNMTNMTEQNALAQLGDLMNLLNHGIANVLYPARTTLRYEAYASSEDTMATWVNGSATSSFHAGYVVDMLRKMGKSVDQSATNLITAATNLVAGINQSSTYLSPASPPTPTTISTPMPSIPVSPSSPKSAATRGAGFAALLAQALLGVAMAAGALP